MQYHLDISRSISSATGADPLGTNKSELKPPKYTVLRRSKSNNASTPEDHFPRKILCLKFTANIQHQKSPPAQHDPDEDVSNPLMDSHHA